VDGAVAEGLLAEETVLLSDEPHAAASGRSTRVARRALEGVMPGVTQQSPPWFT
jgi:hypothetical protein